MCIDGLIPFAPLEASGTEIEEIVAATIERMAPAGLKDPKALARAIVNDLKASGIKRIVL
ncbi:hypothetical protein [Telmatospirillum siberiense]|uniref:Uncharacterized protein n=1 Tax=Telmatospirillum siberiense TaxID=382514 RepID=A0A2N3PQV7_9PROT|nr:hypothetical protein [Telmatospirillum siberiense]PKU22790.1 hypothetical protein CWS72_20180 [Telmatospirillum siberiense]